MRRPDAAGVFGPAINDHLEAMLAEPLPPCAWKDDDGKRCGRPSAVVVGATCDHCKRSARAPFCGKHFEFFKPVLAVDTAMCSYCDVNAARWWVS